MPLIRSFPPLIQGLAAPILLFLWAVVLLCSGCDKSNNGSGNNQKQSASIQKPLRDSLIFEDTPTFDVEYSAKRIDRSKFDSADVKILFVGNSHTRDSPELLGTLYSILQPEKKVLIARSVGGFLIDHAKSDQTLELIRFGDWDVVVLQAQKYSTSGKYVYPTDGAEKLAAEANKMGAQVILFPEWSRREFPKEYLRINEVHEAIAKRADNAVVAPIGQTWVAVSEKHADLDLLHPDGNHASQSGNFVNACVFFSMIEKESPAIPDKKKPDPKRELEKRIGAAVATALDNHVK